MGLHNGDHIAFMCLSHFFPVGKVLVFADVLLLLLDVGAFRVGSWMDFINPTIARPAFTKLRCQMRNGGSLMSRCCEGDRQCYWFIWWLTLCLVFYCSCWLAKRLQEKFESNMAFHSLPRRTAWTTAACHPWTLQCSGRQNFYNPCLQHVGLPNSLLKDQRSMRIVHFLKAKPGNEARFSANEVCKATLPCHKVCQIATKPLYIGLCTHKLTKCGWKKRHFELTETKLYCFTLLSHFGPSLRSLSTIIHRSCSKCL